MRIDPKHHKHIARWVLSGVVLLAANLGVWFGIRSTGPTQGLEPSPGYLAMLILLCAGLAILDILWLVRFAFWCVKLRVGIPEEEQLIHPPTDNPPDDPTSDNDGKDDGQVPEKDQG